jgi:hypothetical protein
MTVQDRGGHRPIGSIRLGSVPCGVLSRSSTIHDQIHRTISAQPISLMDADTNTLPSRIQNLYQSAVAVGPDPTLIIRSVAS